MKQRHPPSALRMAAYLWRAGGGADELKNAPARRSVNVTGKYLQAAIDDIRGSIR
jgi:hypothetical protein